MTRPCPAVADGPAYLNFMINNRCNSMCTFCWSATYRRDYARRKADKDRGADTQAEIGASDAWWDGNTADLPKEVVAYMLDRYKSTVLYVGLCALGEPMLHPDFPAMVHMIQQRSMGLTIAVTTNGSLLHRCMELVDSPGQLIVSIDSARPDEYERLRAGLSFATVTQNMRAAATRAHHPGRRYYTQMAVMACNADDVYPVAQLTVNSGFHGMVVQGGFVGLPTDSEKPVERTDPRVLTQLARIRAEFPGLELVDNFRHQDGVWQTTKGLFCRLPWQQLEVQTSSNTSACCRSAGTELGKYDTDVWRGAKMQRLREQLSSFDVDQNEFSACYACTMKGQP